jgi:pimeloyl-ACP methyl ester carboxylesterase
MLSGTRVYYQSAGMGKEALVFIHGWSCDHSFWRLQAPVWEKRRSLLIDLPGHGRSDKPELAYTMDHFARGVDAVLRDAGVERAVLIGHSMGGPVARQVLRNYPERVKGIVLVDSFFRPWPKDPAAREKAAAGWAQWLAPFRAPGYKDHVARFVASMFVPQTAPELRQEITGKMLSTPQHVMVSAMESMGDPDLWAEDRWDIPVLAVVAKSDSGPRDGGAYLKTLFPNLEYVELPDCGHFLMLERPDRLNELLLKFARK